MKSDPFCAGAEPWICLSQCHLACAAPTDIHQQANIFNMSRVSGIRLINILELLQYCCLKSVRLQEFCKQTAATDLLLLTCIAVGAKC